jgi:hypothetical protein
MGPRLPCVSFPEDDPNHYALYRLFIIARFCAPPRSALTCSRMSSPMIARRSPPMLFSTFAGIWVERTDAALARLSPDDEFARRAQDAGVRYYFVVCSIDDVQRASGDASGGLTSMWAVHYFDRRANRAGMSRSHASSAGALRNACDLMRQNCRVDHITGPDNQRIEASSIESWCRANRNRQRPKCQYANP